MAQKMSKFEDKVKFNNPNIDAFKEKMDEIVKKNQEYNQKLDYAQKVSDDILLKRFTI